MVYRPACLSAAALSLMLSQVLAQPPVETPDTEAITAAIERWLESEHNDASLLQSVTQTVLANEEVGIPKVAALLAASAEDRSTRRASRQLALRVSLGFLQRETSGSVIFAGQYDPLLPLQPFVGNLFFSWLIDTPNWFPDTHRVHLVPALCDLQRTLPDEGLLEAVIEIVENEAIEPEDLRSALACLLWQWGKKSYVQPRIDKLVESSVEGEIEDRVTALLELADLYYALREYETSAVTHRALQSLAAGSEFELKPVDWYSAACVHALNGEIEAGIAALARCAELQNSPDVDVSHKVKREVFEKDPEIHALREHARFAEIVEKAKAGRTAADADPWKKK